MRLVKQSFQIVNQKGFTLKDIYKHIEYCARISYKSQDRMTDTSYEKFVGMLESRDHARPLEFGTVYLTRTNLKSNNMEWLEKYTCNPWSRFSFGEGSTRIDGELWNTIYVTTNYRVIKENHWEDDLKYLCEPTEYHHKRYTVHMTLSRGVMDEFRTHVGLSHLAESTRYCNYSKDKFNNEVTFIKPCWLDIEEKHYTWKETFVDRYIDTSSSMKDQYIASLLTAEQSYLGYLKQGWTPQQARSVLPLGIKSELISCGFEDAWSNFFYRRGAKDAHPMAQEIAKPMHEEFIKLGYCK